MDSPEGRVLSGWHITQLVDMLLLFVCACTPSTRVRCHNHTRHNGNIILRSSDFLTLTALWYS